MGVRNFFPAGRMRRWTTPFLPYASGPGGGPETAWLDSQAIGDTKEISLGERVRPRYPTYWC
ncbi:hypothetical protein OG884_29245 [Streptosporangium sp. NBC_01755]|uniref:hypothetical protein n=1 Tax=unclassified Streptosporangium TaxID=2632669 RepID=UPI002DD931B2|nr:MULTISPECIES: hypothetical protein [unclassified Streptosporangium]WSA22944.1 hypothetical protein OIE13_18345 [Streptosporangium sp. NBC_01810]WSC98913.1 hypothetical protein OG884_29245 [Streptosporangium sp. NBC_01755]